MSEEITLTAEVRRYTLNAMHDTLENGGFQSYDSTELEVLAPASLARVLRVYHDAGTVESTSPWRAIGRQIRLDAKVSDLGGQTLFDGAFRNVRLVER